MSDDTCYCHACNVELKNHESGLCDKCEPDYFICGECGVCRDIKDCMVIDDSYMCKECLK